MAFTLTKDGAVEITATYTYDDLNKLSEVTSNGKNYVCL